MEANELRLEPRHPIGVVCHRARMKADRVRAWERRHGVVEPSRTQGNQRLYSDADIDRLVLLRQAITAGHRIAGLARLSESELQDLVRQDVEDATTPPHVVGGGDGGPAAAIRDSLFAVQRLDRRLLHAALARAASEFDSATFIEGVLAPLVQRVGELWSEGGMTPVHEHLATSVLRTFLEGAGDRTNRSAHGETVVVTTPAGQRHEIGALLAMATAAAEDWNVAYLGADLPAEEIAVATRQARAAMLALSVVYPDDDPDLPYELDRLRRHLGADVRIVVGGRAAAAYRGAIDDIGALYISDLRQLRQTLQAASNRSATSPVPVTRSTN